MCLSLRLALGADYCFVFSPISRLDTDRPSEASHQARAGSPIVPAAADAQNRQDLDESASQRAQRELNHVFNDIRDLLGYEKHRDPSKGEILLGGECTSC